jgi:hypothetical protein
VSVPAAGAVDGLLRAEAIADEGAELRLPPGAYLSRYAYVVCTGAERSACERSLEEAAAGAHLTFAPLD